MSKLFLKTLREDPADAEVPSHRLLQRAGYVRRVAPGIFSWLPLGFLTFRNVEQIVRDEMDAAGFQEVHFPALLPAEPYRTTGRESEYGDTLFRLQDRKKADYVLGPTHEELFTLTVKGEVSSYKELPLSLYQIQTKYRDEARPRAGILRGREFVMKDSYSFDIDDAGLESSYQAHRAAYIKTFERLGLDFVIVSAVSGAMGGSASEEFLAPCENGEDTFVQCAACGYAANTEAVTTAPPPPVEQTEMPAAQSIATPDCDSISALVSFANGAQDGVLADQHWTAADTLKNIVLMTRHVDGTQAPLVVGIPGDREVDLKRLEAVLAPLEIRVFEEADFAKHPELVPGYIGPQVLGEDQPAGIRYLTDPRVAPGTVWLSGSNAAGHHTAGLLADRDFSSDGSIEAVEIREGDTCPKCGGALAIRRGIEIGHIFQLGRKYAEAFGLQVLDQNGKLVTVTMGSYGIGVSRAVAAIAEQTYDDKGLCWPTAVSPADVHILVMGKDPQIAAAAVEIAEAAQEREVRVLLDDRRKASPGVKFKDAELLGVPHILVVGRGVAEGELELLDRRSGDKRSVPIAQVNDLLLELSAVVGATD